MANTMRRRLSAGEVSEMRRLFASGHPIKDLSRKYTVHWSTAERICHRKAYPEVPDDLEPLAPARAPGGGGVVSKAALEMRIDERTRPEMEGCPQGCCQRTAAWIRYAESVDVAAERGGYGLRARKPYKTYDPVVLYAYELDKVLFRVERGGVAVYSPLSAREFANYHGLEIRFAKCQMVIAQLAVMGGTTADAMAEELQSSGLLDGLDALSPERPAE